MKKWRATAILLVAVMLVGVTACGNPKEVSKPTLILWRLRLRYGICRQKTLRHRD